MQTISTPLQQAIAATSMKARPRVIAEWNYNRFIDNISVTNNGLGEQDENWPIESLIDFRYANSGLYRAIAGQAKSVRKKSDVKYRAVSPNDPYKYWRSPDRSGANGVLSNCSPTVNYGRAVTVNKIVIGFEVAPNFTPTAVSVYTINSTGSATLIGTVLPDSNGKIIYYFNGSSWSTTYNITNTTSIYGVRVVVSNMNKTNTNCHMTEISARLVRDLSEDTETVSVSKIYEMDDTVLPVGTMASNSASISIANDTGHYNPENATSPYYGLLGENVRFEVAFGYDTTNFGGAGMEYIPQGVFWSDSWSYDTDNVPVSIECTDSSKMLQQEMVPQCFFKTREDPKNKHEGMLAVNNVVREILARVGWNRIEFRSKPTVRIPYIWYNDDITVWEALSDIAQAVPAAFYFDENDTFIWRDGFNLYANASPSVVVDDDTNLISLSTDFERAANSVTVRYNTYGINERDGTLLYSSLWQPEGTVALRVAELEGNFNTTADRIKLYNTTDDQFATWPESGLVRINQERIRYGAKTQNTDPGEENYTTTNHPSLLDLERGVLGTSTGNHTVGLTGSPVNVRMGSNTGKSSIYEGYLRMANPYSSPYAGRYIRRYGTTATRHRFYSTRLMFTDPAQHNIGGLVIHLQEGGMGVYFELTQSTFARKYGYGEIRSYRMDANGTITELLLGPGGKRGKNTQVVQNVWYTLEVEVSGYNYTVYLDGKNVGTYVLNMGTTSYYQGQYGPYLRAHSVANFEYLMAGDTTNSARVELYQTDSRNSTFSNHHTTSAAGYTEFGNLVHEGREYDIEYDIYPAVIARVFSNNTKEALVSRSIFGPFKGKFVIENYSRTLAVVNGSDIDDFGTSLEYELFISGLAVVRQSEEVKEVSDKESIRRIGKQDIEISTPWIESDEDATRVAQFLVDHWSKPVDNLTINWVPNPAIQVGDLVSVNFESRGFTAATHHYYVIGVDVEAGEGMTSTLTLRRKR